MTRSRRERKRTGQGTSSPRCRQLVRRTLCLHERRQRKIVQVPLCRCIRATRERHAIRREGRPESMSGSVDRCESIWPERLHAQAILHTCITIECHGLVTATCSRHNIAASHHCLLFDVIRRSHRSSSTSPHFNWALIVSDYCRSESGHASLLSFASFMFSRHVCKGFIRSWNGGNKVHFVSNHCSGFTLERIRH